jgi:hypothetical protein
MNSMLLKLCNFFVIVFVSLTSIYSQETNKEFKIKPSKQKEIFDILQKNALIKYNQYNGILSKRKVTNRHYDPTSGELTEVEEALVERIEYFYKKPKVKAITYKKNGIDLDPNSFKPPLTDPPLPLFGPDNEKNYDLNITGETKINGLLCYVIDIQPKFKTDRHLKGKLFIDQKNYKAVKLKASFAKLPFGAKSLDIDVDFVTIDGFSIANKGIIRYTAKVPLIIHERVENEFESIEDSLVK